MEKNENINTTAPQTTKPTTKSNNTTDITVKVINESGMTLPTYANPTDAGLDLRAAIDSPVVVPAGRRLLIGTGIKMAIPEGYECQIRPRSGLALKHGITVLNTPGTIDCSFRGEVGVILFNSSTANYVVNPGDKIAQAVFNRFAHANLVEVDELDKTDRGEGGFGSTGK